MSISKKIVQSMLDCGIILMTALCMRSTITVETR